MSDKSTAPEDTDREEGAFLASMLGPNRTFVKLQPGVWGLVSYILTRDNEPRQLLILSAVVAVRDPSAEVVPNMLGRVQAPPSVPLPT